MTVAGRAYAEHAKPLQVVGALLEARAVHTSRSAYNHLHALAATHGIARPRVDEAIEMVGLQDVARKRAGGFSLERLALRLMSERRRELVQSRTKTVNHLHQLLMELLPAGAEQKLTASKAKALLATVRPRNAAGKARSSGTTWRSPWVRSATTATVLASPGSFLRPCPMSKMRARVASFGGTSTTVSPSATSR